MAGKEKPIVSIDGKGEIAGYFESTAQAARCLGMYVANLHRAVRKGRLCKGKKWMYESDYRDYWMEGRTNELAYSEHEIRSQRAARAWSRLTPDQKKERGKLISKAHRASAKVQNSDTTAAYKATSRAVMCVSTGERFESIAKCARGIGASPSGVARALKEGKRIKGFIVKYI